MITDNQTRDFKGIWIPKEIWLSEELNLQEKCLLVEIDSLSSLGQCFASNDHFAKFLSLSKDRVSRMISGLKVKGFIEVDFTYKNNTKEIEKRIITTEGYRQKQLGGYRQKQLGGIGENNDTPIGENTKGNNTVFNNTINNTHTGNSNNPKKPSILKELCVEIQNVLGEKFGESKLKDLINQKGIATVMAYVANWDKYKPYAKASQSAYFVFAVSNELPEPQKNQQQTQSYNNFEQRTYTNEELEEFYVDVTQ